jgi:hypothetical protein
MAEIAAQLVDRVLPVVPVRQWVLSLPYGLRRRAAFDPKALSTMSRIFAEEVFRHYRGPFSDAKCGAVTFVQRFGGSLNLNVHFHLLALDGVFVGERSSPKFLPSTAPARSELHDVVKRTCDRILAKLRTPTPSDEDPDAIEACAAAAMQPGLFVELPQREEDPAAHDIPESHAAAEHDGFNLHAGVRITADDDQGRERLCRYGARPALASSRFRKLSDGRIAYRVKYADKGKAKHRIMTPVELLARISALIPPPRYPLIRYHGVLAPASMWREHVIPKPPDKDFSCPRRDPASATILQQRPVQPTPTDPKPSPAIPQSRPMQPTPAGPKLASVIVAPNILSIPHWKRLGEGALLAKSPRIDWATLLRRTFESDALECPKCRGRLEVRGVVMEPSTIHSLLSRLEIEPAPKLARARDPTALLYADAIDGP